MPHGLLTWATPLVPSFPSYAFLLYRIPLFALFFPSSFITTLTVLWVLWMNLIDGNCMESCSAHAHTYIYSVCVCPYHCLTTGHCNLVVHQKALVEWIINLEHQVLGLIHLTKFHQDLPQHGHSPVNCLRIKDCSSYIGSFFGVLVSFLFLTGLHTLVHHVHFFHVMLWSFFVCLFPKHFLRYGCKVLLWLCG